MQVIKLTDQNMRTYNGFQWEIGAQKEASGEGKLCSNGWFHAYESQLLAIMHNPIHGNFNNPRMFIADTLDGKILRDRQTKLGSSKMVLLREMDIPEVTTTQRVAYGILCALEVCMDKKLRLWASRWLSGEDRSGATAAEAARAAEAADAAGWAADAAGWAAEAAEEASAASAAAAAWAATAAAADDVLNLKLIAEKAMNY